MRPFIKINQKIALAFLLVGLVIPAFAQLPGAAKTRRIVDSLLNSPNAYTKKTFSKTLPYKVSVETTGDYRRDGTLGLCYEKWYYPNGKIRKEGLGDLYYSGCWFYYDSTGKLYKEYDFDTKTKKLYGMTEEPYQWAFDSVQNMTERFARHHYGSGFYGKYIRVQAVYWGEEGRLTYSDCLPDQPLSAPGEYAVSVHIVYNDSVDGARLEMTYDKDLKYKGCSLAQQDTAGFYPKINVSYLKALSIAKKNGFKGPCYLEEWDNAKKTFYWRISKTISLKSNPRGEERIEKTIRIDAKTGLFKITRQQTGTVADGFISDYRREVKDAVILKPGWKTLEFDRVIFNVPGSYKPFELYYPERGGTRHIVTHNADTLEISSRCGVFVSIDPVPSDKNLDLEFEKIFPASLIQGRKVTAKFYHSPVQIRMECRIEESGVSIHCVPLLYFIKASVKPENKPELFEILKTLRFQFSK